MSIFDHIGGINGTSGEFVVPPEWVYQDSIYFDLTPYQSLFTKHRVKRDLKTHQKMKVFTFLHNLENAKVL